MRWMKLNFLVLLNRTREVGAPGKLVTFPDHEDSKYCLPSLIKHYLERTRDRRSGKYARFFLSTVKPYHPVLPCTIARRLVDVLKGTGIYSSTRTRPELLQQPMRGTRDPRYKIFSRQLIGLSKRPLESFTLNPLLASLTELLHCSTNFLKNLVLEYIISFSLSRKDIEKSLFNLFLVSCDIYTNLY